MEAAGPNLPAELEKENPPLFQDYLAHSAMLEQDLYEKLSEMSIHCGMGPGSKGMAIIALTACTDLFKQCGIEDEKLEALVKASVKSIDAAYDLLGRK
jgi:hypothetical protein